jgi:hypothetical protein
LGSTTYKYKRNPRTTKALKKWRQTTNKSNKSTLTTRTYQINKKKKKKKERKGEKDIIAKSIIPKKWSEMEQEETTHSVRVDGIKLRNRTTQGEER